MFGIQACHPQVKQGPLRQGQHLMPHLFARGQQLLFDRCGRQVCQIVDGNEIWGGFRQNLLLPGGKHNGAQGVMPIN